MKNKIKKHEEGYIHIKKEKLEKLFCWVLFAVLVVLCYLQIQITNILFYESAGFWTTALSLVESGIFVLSAFLFLLFLIGLAGDEN